MQSIVSRSVAWIVLFRLWRGIMFYNKLYALTPDPTPTTNHEKAVAQNITIF